MGLTDRSRNTFGFVLIALASAALGAVDSTPGEAMPFFGLKFADVVKNADFVGIVTITEVPQAPRTGFRASTPPVVTATPVAVFKGEAKGDIHFVWQTHYASCKPRDPDTVEIVPPVVGEEYMVYLVKRENDRLRPLSEGWDFCKMPAAPTVRLRSSHNNAWRSITEVSPAVAGPGEAVRYRQTYTRLAAEAWTGEESNLTAGDIGVVDFTRKQVLDLKKSHVRKSAPLVLEKGQSFVDVIDLTEAFGITKPGEYWVFCSLTDEHAPLRFEISDKLRIRK